MEGKIHVKDFMGEDEEKLVKQKRKNEEEFKKLQEDFSIQDAVDQFILKKELFILKREGDVFNEYQVDDKVLGEGTYGVVFRAKDKTTGEEVAIKRIPREKIRNYQRFLNEITALKTLDHPNVIKLFEIFEDEDDVYLVQELCTGGELFDYIVNQEFLSEFQAATIFQQILHSITYCHKNAIAHRDLKPENFMFKSSGEGSNLKLIDFGLSTSYFKSTGGQGEYTRMTTRAGTAFFMAPEVLEANYSNACDMWSCGVILYVMLCGYPPFDGDTEEEILLNVQSGEYDFDDEVWDKVSEEAKDLIKKLLVPEDQRLSPKEALDHPWLKNRDIEQKKQDLGTNHIKRLKKFQKAKNFKKAVLTFIASRVSDSEIEKEIEVFRSLDKNKDGYITMLELKAAMRKHHSEEEVEEIMRSCDTDKNGAINYTEFIAATLDNLIIGSAKRIEKAFKLFDKDKDGKINAKELEEVLSGEGVKVSDKQVFKDILKECDINNDGEVDFEEFQKCMLQI
jgi:calcium-dependent protein kinase